MEGAQMRSTPENITKLERHQIFVFGSNTAGVHGKGAAKVARDLFGAQKGVAEGPTGKCYAIPTRIYIGRDEEHWKVRFAPQPLNLIEQSVYRFIEYAEKHPELEFLVTKFGTGYAGYDASEIKPFFQYMQCWNIILPECFQPTGSHEH
jgi:hypothetical protein